MRLKPLKMRSQPGHVLLETDDGDLFVICLPRNPLDLGFQKQKLWENGGPVGDETENQLS